MKLAIAIILALVATARADHPPLARPARCPLPAMPGPAPGDVVVTPAAGSWSVVRTQVTAATHQILITPGDYESWGYLDVGPTWPSGTTAAPIIIRYYDPATEALHPVDRAAPATEARIHGIMWWGDVHDYVAHGLTIRAPAPMVNGGLFHVLNADRVLLDGNLVEDSAQSYGIRVRDSAGVCVQHNVIRNATNPANDNTGINVWPYTTDIVGLRIVGNEIYDWIDAIQIGNLGALRVNAQIVDNDLYTTAARHVQDPATGVVYGCTENGIDIKAPSITTSYIMGNRIWGYRETPPTEQATLCGAGFASGSAGDAIMIHVDAVGVTIEENEISECVSALRAANRAGGRRLAFRRNKVTHVPPIDASTRFYNGAALVLEDDAIINGNTFDGVPLLCPRNGDRYPTWPPAGYSPAPPRVLKNVTRSAIDSGNCSTAAIVEEMAP